MVISNDIAEAWNGGEDADDDEVAIYHCQPGIYDTSRFTLPSGSDILVVVGCCWRRK